MPLTITRETPKHKTSFVTISKDEYESMQATLEVLQDKDLMNQLRKSEDDIKKGMTSKLSDLSGEEKEKRTRY